MFIISIQLFLNSRDSEQVLDTINISATLMKTRSAGANFLKQFAKSSLETPGDLFSSKQNPDNTSSCPSF